MNPPVIAIDGPSASGKGTIAKKVAGELGFHYLESGALYRLIALIALRQGLQDEAAIADAAEHMDVVFQEDEILIEDQDVSSQIRHETVGNRASEIAPLPSVRQALLKRQRGFRQPPGLVADGRDMGTVIFPDAPFKVFLTASAEERAERRYKQLKDKGVSVTLAGLLREILARDARDASRAVAPLRPADDAVHIDTTGLGIDQVVERVLALLPERRG